MPIYVYEPTIFAPDEPVNECCYFETLQSMSEAPLQKCPTCGHAIHRAVSTFSFSTSAAPGRSGSTASDFRNNGGGAGANPASNAARMAMRHVCASGCRH